MKRGSGILMHITSLPSPYGIGTLGDEAYEFVDFLERAGQGYWQILPLGPTSYGDSPYQSFSSFAGNPNLIDMNLLVEEELLTREELEVIDFGDNREKVDYAKIFNNKLSVLKKVFERGYEKYQKEISVFRWENKEWLEDYCLYMAIKNHFGLKSWQEWDIDIKLREKVALDHYKKLLKNDVAYWEFLQFIFFKQWNQLKTYANSKGIQIIGDIPIYVAEDSVDTWADGNIFLLDENKSPIKVAGCPPDAFSEDGQLWGNPLYDWDYLEKQGYAWWIKRIEGNMKLFDIIRIDHFRGFESYWAIPNGSKTAATGEWEKGPGIKLFNAIKAALGDIHVIAEDLGFLTQEVIDFKEETGYPGMKVLQFAFDTREESDYLPHNYDKNCVVYTGTHDNDTITGWIECTIEDDINFAENYLKLNEAEGYHWGFIRGAWSSVGNLAVAQMQDFLGLSSEARMNIPSTIGGNWQWRIKEEELTEELADEIFKLTKTYGRLLKNVK